MKDSEVNVALEILLEEVELVMSSLNRQCSEALEKSDYNTARRAIDKAEALDEFRNKVKALQREWTSIADNFLSSHEKARRATYGRLPRGVRTPEDAFRRPILEVLVELGGKGEVGKVLERVGEKMKNVLTEYDLEPLPSDQSIRWRNTAQWCRNTLVREGLMKSDSPRGTWEISDEGRKALENEIAVT